MFKKILVPLNGSLHAEQALELVKKLWPKNEFELVLLEATGNPNLVYSVYGFGTTSYVQVSPGCLIKNSDYIKNITEKTEHWAPQVEGFVKFDTAERAIIDVAVHEDVDLIVMVTHDYKGFERLLFKSVTEQVIRDAPCPVLAIRDGHIPKHMLIAVDGTPFSETILEPAFELAKLIKADITLARVDRVRNPLRDRDVAEIKRFDPNLADAVLYNSGQEANLYLKALWRHYLDEADEIKVNLDFDLARGRPEDRLAEMAERNGCDLIAMATHGRKGLDRFWNRSVTEDVIRQTETAMLVLHPEPEAELA
ncbi:MAG: universal stress protein [Anaerolineae bacterium]